MRTIASPGLCLVVMFLFSPTNNNINAQSFTIGKEDFLLNGKPFQIRSGEMHAARIPPEYWRHRLQMVRAMGCNTVCAYLFWNMHEPQPGKFDFTGPANAAEYCRIAQEVGLNVILRPGPYSCAEWEFGGLPWWLLKYPDMKVRTRDTRYLEAVRRYLLEVGKQLAPLQRTQGGPIIMVQVENEYGSYGNDREYIGTVRDDLKDAGFDVPFFTCDGPTQLPNDTRPEIFSVVNFGDDPKGSFEWLRKIRPSGPLMCGEYYPGWFDSWGKEHHTGSTENILKDLGYMLENDASFSIYMVHGGTSFGFSAGANSPPFMPQSTSYDYDAPIDEAGRATTKYYAIRELFAKHLLPGETLPDVPPANPVIAIPPFSLNERTSLFDNLGSEHSSKNPISMELIDQSQGCILYRIMLPAGTGATLRIQEAHDIARIFVDGKRVGAIDRRFPKKNTVPIGPFSKEVRLDILVEAMGRINYGKDIHDRKGILGAVEILKGNQSINLTGWKVYSLPLDSKTLSHLIYSASLTSGPAFHRGTFTLVKTGDTFLDMQGWGKGNVWVNGHHLGRFWHIGPQQTLYLPGVWLNEGKNEIVVLELEENQKHVVQGVTIPILDSLENDEYAPPPPVRTHGTLQLDSADAVKRGMFAEGSSAQDFTFSPVSARHICLQSLSSWRSDPFASIAELYVLDEKNQPLSRERWKIEFVDSEELDSEDGHAENSFDNDMETIWHSEWSNKKPLNPHSIVIDIGEQHSLSGFRYVPRQTDSPGRIKEFQFYAKEEAFKIIK